MLITKIYKLRLKYIKIYGNLDDQFKQKYNKNPECCINWNLPKKKQQNLNANPERIMVIRKL